MIEIQDNSLMIAAKSARAAGFIRIPRKIFVLKKIFALILHFEFYRYIILVLTFYNHIIIALEKPNINILLLEILKSTIDTYNVTTLVFLGIRLVAVYGRHQVVGLPLWGQPLWRKRIQVKCYIYLFLFTYAQ